MRPSVIACKLKYHVRALQAQRAESVRICTVASTRIRITKSVVGIKGNGPPLLHYSYEYRSLGMWLKVDGAKLLEHLIRYSY